MIQELQHDGLPSSLHTEIAILGAMMLDTVALSDATAKLRADDFTLDTHRRIYRAVIDLLSAKHGVDLLTVRDALARRHELDAIGGPGYLAHLTEGIPYRLNIESYVRIVKHNSLLRQAHGVFVASAERCAAGEDDPTLIISDAEQALQDVRAEVATERTLAEQAEAEWERLERQCSGDEVAFVTTGIPALNRAHGGYAIGEMTLLAARPNIGKSTALRQGIIANCTAGNFVHLISPEMMAGRVLRCLWAAVAQMPYALVRHPEKMTEAQRHYLKIAMEVVAGWPLLIDDSPSIAPVEVVARARRVKRKCNTQLLGIDYIQQLEIPGGPQHRAAGISAAGRMFSDLAKEGMAVVAVSALTEEDGKKGGIPTMHHLRGSGDLKYQADNVYLLHRDFDVETQRLQPKTLLIAGKGRGESTGSMTLFFSGAMQAFETEEEFNRRMR